MTHLEQAKQYLTIAESGDSKREAYKLAAEEIVEHIAETSDSQTLVATKIGRDTGSVSRLLRWRKEGYPEGTTPFTMADPNGSLPTQRAALSHTKKVLRDAPLEQVEQIIDELPEERKRAIKAAVGDDYARLLQNSAERERNMTEAQRQEIAAAQDSITEGGRRAVASFSTLGVVGHLEQATEELRELVSDQSLTLEMWREVEKALNELYEEAQVAAAMVGLDFDLQEA